MRTMLLSFKPDVYKRVVSGEKIFEHRKVFPNELIRAYLYVSSPVQAIVGIMELGKRTELEKWKEKYKSNEIVLNRVNRYLENYKYVMQINSFQNTSEISLKTLREECENFIVPQMYYYIDNTEIEKYLINNLSLIGPPISHDFTNVDENKICII